MAMWFRRKKEADTEADTELTDTLRSMRSLLEGPESGGGDESAAPKRGQVSTADGADLESAEGNISNAVASDEHLEWDFNVDMAADERRVDPPDTSPLKSVEFQSVSNPRVGNRSDVIPLRGGSRADDSTAHAAARPVDGIPVLNNIVHLPEGDAFGGVDAAEFASEKSFVEQCLKDIRKRLKRNEMTSLTPAQEKRLRVALTSLRLQKTSGKFE
jgi:hypothetical protein